jgi:hypothetical protein
MSSNTIMPQGLAHALNQVIVLRVASFTFDTAKKDTSGVSNKTVAAHKTGVLLPAHCIIVGGFVDTNTVFTSANTTATLAISVETANDIINAAQINASPGSAIGRKAIIPKANTPESTSVKTTEEREITVTVGTEALTAGKLTGYLYYLEGVASA